MNISSISSSAGYSSIFNQDDVSNTSETSGFGDFLSESLTALNDSQNKVAKEQQALIDGEISAHQLMATVSESQLTLKLFTSIASKSLTAIQELTNMQI